ncbi:MAG TPA: cadherin repeat domain-containing protein [Rugosimonospora sp.]|nr:cadherin repeat domain-containing protein [Rugosimonospora sp.]
MPEYPERPHDQIRRRQLLAGMAAAGVPLVAGTRRPPSPFPEMPDASITTTQDREQMLWQLGIPVPQLPPRATDPNRPPNTTPRDPADPEGNWADPLGHFVTRAAFGQWITYDDDAGLAGGAVSPFGDYGPTADPRYPDIELLRMRDGRPVRTPEDWWLRRRPEILRLVRDNLYGRIPDRSRWPRITWTSGPPSLGTANGVSFRDRVITGTIDTSGYPQLRDTPVIQGTLRTPLDAPGPVPVIVTFDPSTSAWRFTAPHGYGLFAYNATALQPDSGGANLSSYLIGLINKGRWRAPLDWGALAVWGWGISRLIDYFETDPAVDATRVGVQGHSRFGKATLVAAAYDERIGAAFPSSAGALGTSWARRAWGETLELVSGADTEYHWVAGNIMRYAGELHPGRYWPRRVARLPVDVHCVLALIAPRVVLTNGGTDTPPGFGDAWTDPRGMYLAGAFSSPAWELLGWPGQVIPPGTVFTSGPGESIGGTPPIDVAFIDGTVGWRRHAQGHTPVPDWPSFMELATRHLDGARPVVRPGQLFTLGHGAVVGTVAADGAAGDQLGNWQIIGGTGVGLFTIDRVTGTLSATDPRRLLRARHARFTLRVVVDNRRLTSHPETVTIDVVPG